MKLPKRPSSINPLKEILDLFTDEFEDLSLDNLETMTSLLREGDIVCHEYHETFRCLQVLEELKVIELQEFIDKQTGYTSYKVRKTL